MTKIFKTLDGYEIVKNSRELYAIIGDNVKYLGVVSPNYRSSGFLLKNIPNHIKKHFFNIQRNEQQS